LATRLNPNTQPRSLRVTIHISIDIYGAAEKRAFAKFLEESAKADDARPKDTLGGIDKASNPMWQTQTYAAEAGLPEAAQAAPSPAEVESDARAPTRKRGEPSPGKQRRTKAEIAEDEARDVADASVKNQIIPAISETPEDRQDPNNPDVTDDAETAEADAADEAAETAAASTGKLTLDHVRAALKLYITAYGIAATQEDGPLIISSVCGEGKIKVSDVADGQIADVIAAIKAAGKANTYKRELLVAS
jgi:hypothetical protein